MNDGIAPCPFVTRSITSAFGGFAWSRFGPTVPLVPASASVWQLPQVVVKIVFPSVGLLGGHARACDPPDVRADVRSRLVLVVDTEGVAVDVVALGQRLVGARHARCSRGRLRDREEDLVDDDVGEGRVRHPGLSRLRERVVEVRPDRAGRPGLRKRVAAAAAADEEVTAGGLVPLVRVAARAAAREDDDRRSHAGNDDEGHVPPGAPHRARV